MIHDAWQAVVRRWHSTSFSIAAIAVGMLAVVATLGIAQSAATNVAASLRDLSGTTATVRITAPVWGPASAVRDRLLHVNGVADAGLYAEVPAAASASVSIASIRADATGSMRLVIADGDGLVALGAHARAGVLPVGPPNASAEAAPSAATRAPRSVTDATVVLGPLAAARLLVSPEDGLQRMTVGDTSVQVAGVLGGADGALDNVLVISPGLAEHLGVLPDQQTFVLNHAGDIDVEEVALAAHPSAPEDTSVELSLDPEALRASISSDTTTLILVLTGVTLAASGIGVANTMLTSVWQRRSEIGIMRALGAPRRRVASVFLVESGIIGLLGGVIGTVAGVVVGAGAARLQDWTYTLPPAALAAPAVGLLVGTVFGVLPALRAAGVSPAGLLRSE